MSSIWKVSFSPLPCRLSSEVPGENKLISSVSYKIPFAHLEENHSLPSPAIAKCSLLTALRSSRVHLPTTSHQSRNIFKGKKSGVVVPCASVDPFATAP